MGLELLVSILWIFNLGGPASPVTARPCSDPMGMAQDWTPTAAVGSWDFSQAEQRVVKYRGEIRPA